MDNLSGILLILGSCYLIFVLTYMDTTNSPFISILLWKIIPILLLIGMLFGASMEYGFIINTNGG